MGGICSTSVGDHNPSLFADYLKRDEEDSSGGDSNMSDVFDPSERVRVQAHVRSMEDYRAMYKESVEKPAEFWGKIAAQFHWQTPPSADKFLEYNFDVSKVRMSSTLYKI